MRHSSVNFPDNYFLEVARNRRNGEWYASERLLRNFNNHKKSIQMGTEPSQPVNLDDVQLVLNKTTKRVGIVMPSDNPSTLGPGKYVNIHTDTFAPRRNKT